MSREKSQCEGVPPEELRRVREKLGIERRRFGRAARRTQVLVALTACGPSTMRRLSKIIGSYTGEDPENVRRILYRHIDLLQDLWLIEKSDGTLKLAPLGLLLMALEASLPYMRYWVAERIEEAEPSLSGLRVFLENSDRFARERPGAVFPEPLTEVETLFYSLNTLEIKAFNDNDPVAIMDGLARVFMPYFIEEYLYDLYKYDINEFEQALERHIKRLRRIVETLKACSLGACPEDADEVLIDELLEFKGLLDYIDALDTSFVEHITGWPRGKPPLRSSLALVAAGTLLPKDPADIIGGLARSEGRISELLGALLTVYALDGIWGRLDEIAEDVKVLAAHKSSVLSRLWVVKSNEYRDLLGALILLGNVLSQHEELFLRRVGREASKADKKNDGSGDGAGVAG